MRFFFSLNCCFCIHRLHTATRKHPAQCFFFSHVYIILQQHWASLTINTASKRMRRKPSGDVRPLRHHLFPQTSSNGELKKRKKKNTPSCRFSQLTLSYNCKRLSSRQSACLSVSLKQCRRHWQRRLLRMLACSRPHHRVNCSSGGSDAGLVKSNKTHYLSHSLKTRCRRRHSGTKRSHQRRPMTSERDLKAPTCDSLSLSSY